MASGIETARKTFLRILATFQVKKLVQTPATVVQPLRSELFSADQMERHGRILANLHQTKHSRSRDHLLPRLAENEIKLLEVQRCLEEDIRIDRRITPAGEWLLDNFYLIEEQIRTAKKYLPKQYSRELPYIENGPSAGLPRVFDLAFETIAHGDGRVDPENLSRFVSAYQSEVPLQLGELWAIPIMLRLALIENLRRVADRIFADLTNRNHAEHWAEQMIEVAANHPTQLILVIADMARSNPPMESSFVAELTRLLQGHGPALALPLTWMEQQLSESGVTVEQLVRAENQNQSTDQVTMSNSVGSLRFLGTMDWHEFVETMSTVEQILSQDPVDLYSRMEFDTRDQYRHVVEKVARRSPLSESEVAGVAIELARQGSTREGAASRESHVGYYLIDKGLPLLERQTSMRLSPVARLGRLLSRFSVPLYASAIFLFAVITTAGFLAKASSGGLHGWVLVPLAALFLIAASPLAVGLVNWLMTLTTNPSPLPRMDYSHGIPSEFRTLAVIPTMLTSAASIDALVEALEVCYLGNRDQHLHFGLLTDFRDANKETLPEDQPLLQQVQHGIEKLNHKYRSFAGNTFFLFHRPRRWNPREGMWMGYERKRGKLLDLNRMLRGGDTTPFAVIIGDVSVLSNVKYIITLDTDTQLARDTARQFIGTMTHPLNRPFYDEKHERVVAGYGILQPRLAVSLAGTRWSRYARMCTTESGIDPYTRAVSDVYQDLFGEGSFIGKGIYDVDAIERTLADRFPENRILSHDLLEGCYARSGLLSDVQLYENYPSAYFADVNRRYRWIRGDWQIAQWALPLVPNKTGHTVKNPLSALSMVKIFDNLRRSVTSAGLTLLLLLGWFVLVDARFWTLAVIGIVILPTLLAYPLTLLRKPGDQTLAQHLSAEFQVVANRLLRDVFTLVCLPFEAAYSLDAIARTLWRMVISHRRLMQWNPSSDDSQSDQVDIARSVRKMWSGPFVAIVAFIGLVLFDPAALMFAALLLGLWFFSPIIVWWMSRPPGRRLEKLSADQIVYLNKLARKTWSFFETFVGPEDHWLPPDNYQEQPVSAVAHRTSPTNIGLSLLAALAAYDFGMISAGKLIDRTAHTFATMASLERYKGHFFNWYDTQTLKPLSNYISSVDSGNLAGHLLTLHPGLLGLIEEKIVGPRVFDSLRTSLEILRDTMAVSQRPVSLDPLDELQQILTAARTPPASLIETKQLLQKLVTSSSHLIAHLEISQSAPQGDELDWARAFAVQCADILDDLTELAPWIGVEFPQQAGDRISSLDSIPTLLEVAALSGKLQPEFDLFHQIDESEENGSEVAELERLVVEGSQHAAARIAMVQMLATQSQDMSQMDVRFLYNESRHLLTIGHNAGKQEQDASCYDLLASEARFSCFVAIAQGQLPQKSWFSLGRLLTNVGGDPALLSWSGSMFEYLMPLLVMPTYPQTLLDQTCRAVVARQIDYGNKSGVPWGISESGYNAIDAQRNYQYRAFGVPGLGLQRGLAQDLVIAPYASALALMISPLAACENLERLSGAGYESRFGLYEAIDFTPSRLPRGKSNAIVHSFMAHHQGMSLLSLARLLLDQPMQKRFASNPQFQATMLLLQERIPKLTSSYKPTTGSSKLILASDSSEIPIRVFTTPDTANPQVQLLSNGRYHVMITNAGGGYSRWKDIAVTRWNEDRTCDNWGNFCYLRDVDSGDMWSATYQPALKSSPQFEAVFSEGRAEFRGSDHSFDTYCEIAVSPEDDIEMRRVRVTNRAKTRRVLEVTSYAEVVLAPAIADALHPAFSNLFVQTEILSHERAILCTRRPRSPDEKAPWMMHLMTVHGADVMGVSYETDRMKFIGRGNTVVNPAALTDIAAGGSGGLSNSEGSVLDPIVAIQYRIALDPGESATVYMVTGIGGTRETALGLVERYRDRRLADRVFDLIWAHGQVLLRQLNAMESDAQLYLRLASSIIYPNAVLRAPQSIILKNRRGQSGLWGYAISGDLPIVLLQIEDPANIELVRQLVQAHAYWRLKGLVVDLVIWNEDNAGYRQLLHDKITDLIAAASDAAMTDKPGGIYVRPVDQIAEDDRILIQTVAHIILTDRRGSLAEQMGGQQSLVKMPPLLDDTPPERPEHKVVAPQSRSDLTFFNGLGGFTQDGREYVITTGRGRMTPAPWVNVLANPTFGTVVSESGMGYTWSENAHEFRLTPWGNDPVSDASGEAFYLRDEDRGTYWSPTPLPCCGTTPYVSRHGFGYSVFEHEEHGIRSEMWVYVAMDAAVKFTVLTVRNMSSRTRHLSATGYVEWVLGGLKPKSAQHVITEIDLHTNALMARNPYNTDFPERTAFFEVDEAASTRSGDRTEFIGRNGTLRSPAAMRRTELSGRVGAALDPCGAIRVRFDLEAGQEQQIVFRLGMGTTRDDTRNLIRRFRGGIAAREALESVWQHWTHTLGAVNVETPDPSLNVLVNGWLLYQTLACRLWARSAFYQSGGAFGYRDQLQDVMALVHSRPQLTRQHLLLCAAHQFTEGDVQHWWHPPTDRGVRTHCSDDYLWLPLATSRYVLATGDTGVLDEMVSFLSGREVPAEEDSYFDLPTRSDEIATLYEHCVRAIQNGLKFGSHGLPLIGSCDWNDGMNLVGDQGKGESIWLAFFLVDVLHRFSGLARARGDLTFAELCDSQAVTIGRNIDEQGWDGEWYRRAYFDDGTPLGSATNEECQIDSIAQSWSVLSGAGDQARSRTAMDSLEKWLVRQDLGIVQLLDPPFNASAMNPGYIKGYAPGIRENGGQYTHAAIWAAMAFAKMGDERHAWELFRIINPVNHARSEDESAIYMVEPYVVAADVYAVTPHVGRGGWTWYTGAAGWMYTLIVESLLGVTLEVDKLRIKPCLPPEWKSFGLHYRHWETTYHIDFKQIVSDVDVLEIVVDGKPQADNTIPLQNDKNEHYVKIKLSTIQKNSLHSV